jgi:hypothetical protein
MKKGGSSVNESDLNKDSIIKPILDNLMEEDRKTLKAYHKEVDELFFSRYLVKRQRLTEKEAVPIVIHKAKVAPKVRSSPTLSLDDVQYMINSALVRQVKSSDELMHRLIEERDRKNLVNFNVDPSSSCAVNFSQTNPQPSGTSQPNPSA